MRIALLVGALFVGCGSQEGSSAAEQSSASSASEHQATGSVVSIADDRSSITINHEDIPDVMPAMTMPFSVDDAALLEGLSTNDRVSFAIAEKPGGGYRIVRIQKQ